MTTSSSVRDLATERFIWRRPERGPLTCRRAAVDEADFLHHADPSRLPFLTRHDDLEGSLVFFQGMPVACVSQEDDSIGETRVEFGGAKIAR